MAFINKDDNDQEKLEKKLLFGVLAGAFVFSFPITSLILVTSTVVGGIMLVHEGAEAAQNVWRK